MTYQVFDAKLVEHQWQSLYKLAGVAALLSALLIPIQIAVFLAYPLPDSVIGWFALFQRHRLIGLIDLDLLLVADNVLLIPIFLALYVPLRRTSESVMILGTVLGLGGLVLLIVSNPAIEMLSLSDQYAAATTDEQRALFVAVGQALLAGWQGTAFQVAYILGSVAGVAVSVVMLWSGIFPILRLFWKPEFLLFRNSGFQTELSIKRRPMRASWATPLGWACTFRPLAFSSRSFPSCLCGSGTSCLRSGSFNWGMVKEPV